MTAPKQPRDLVVTLPGAMTKAVLDDVGSGKMGKALTGKHTFQIMDICLEASARIIELVEKAVIEDETQRRLPLDNGAESQ